MKNMHYFLSKLINVEVIAYLTRIVRVTVELHAIVDIFPDVNWAAVDETMNSASKPPGDS